MNEPRDRAKVETTVPVAGVKAWENIRGALIAAKNEYPGSRWNDAEHDPLAQFDALVKAYRQACSNLACSSFRGKDTSLGEEADRWEAALLAGWSGVEGWPDGE